MDNKKTQHTDGITKAETVVVTIQDFESTDIQALRDILPGTSRAMDPKSTGAFLDSVIGPALDYWRAQPSGDDKSQPLTAEWYRDRIVHSADLINEIVAQRDHSAPLNKDNLEWWIVSAVQLGSLITEAEWRFNYGDHIRRDRKTLKTLAANIREGITTRQSTRAGNNVLLREKVDAARTRHAGISDSSLAALLTRNDPAYKEVTPASMRMRIRRLR